MSLRRPTVARPLFTFDISPLWDVASDVRLWHALSFIFHYKPFMWCRPDARLRHCYSFCILSRSHSDTRLALSITLGFREDYRPTSLLFPHALLSLCLNTLVKSVHMHHVYICYILCPNCLASTFIVLTWLVDLARCWRGRSHGWRVR